MDKKLLLGIINNGIDEIKLLTSDFINNEPSQKHIDITIQKVEILLKELALLRDDDTKMSENIIRELITPSIEVKKEVKKEAEKKPDHKIVEVKRNIPSNEEPLIERTKKPIVEKFQQEKIVKEENTAIKVEDHAKEIKPSLENKDKTVDIRSFIGINDKFLFIRELFDSNIDDYLEFIEDINKIEEKKDAIKTISNKNWDKEEDSTKLLTEIINRKFI